MGSLKTFIKQVRKAKTIADERTVVRKESAAIRTSFRDPNLDHASRRVSISKLLYLHILGEKTHFGQVECLKLLSSARFADKRLGYLAAALLLDENQEVLTLLTNSLDNDMQHPNTFIVGLALSCLGTVASPELARDLYTNVDSILAASASVYLKKKACSVAAKLTEKDPDLAEVFAPRLAALIADKSPSVLLGTCKLVQAIYTHSPESRPGLVRLVPRLLAHLKRVVSSGYMPDYDVAGVADPFLQAALLATVRLLAGDASCAAQTLEEVNDAVAQVASGLDGGKNASHAVLYECVRTIFALRADPALRVLGVNLLGKFLANKDNNTRYVALEMLLAVIDSEPQAVQRHRATIVGCLSDGDVSIRRRALELAFAIINEQNVRVLSREVLAFLGAGAEPDLKPYVTAQLAAAAARYAPTEKWHFDTVVRMLKVAGSHMPADVVSGILADVMRCEDVALKTHVVARLVSASVEDGSQHALAMVTIWCVGEYADLVLGSEVEISGHAQTVSEALLLRLLDSYVNNTGFSEAETVQLVSAVLTAAIKLSVKFHDARAIEQLRMILSAKSYDTNLEIQTRALEYQHIFGQDDALRSGLVARMPAPPVREKASLTLQGKPKETLSQAGSQARAPSATEDLLDLLDDTVTRQPAPAAAASGTNNDLLNDIFGSSSAPAPVAAPSALDSPAGTEVFSNGHLRITFAEGRFGDGNAVVDADITSTAQSHQIEKVQLLIAVPKTQKLTIATVAGTDSLVSSPIIKQTLKIAGTPGAKVKLRVKVKYQLDGEARDDQFDYAGFKTTL